MVLEHHSDRVVAVGGGKSSGVREVAAGGEGERNRERVRVGARVLALERCVGPSALYRVAVRVVRRDLEASATASGPNGDDRSDRRTRTVIKHVTIDAATDEHIDLRSEICQLVLNEAPRAATESHRVVLRRVRNAAELKIGGRVHSGARVVYNAAGTGDRLLAVRRPGAHCCRIRPRRTHGARLTRVHR